jgi:hypothetical protein
MKPTNCSKRWKDDRINADESRLEILNQVESVVLTPAKGAGLLAILEGDQTESGEQCAEAQVTTLPDSKAEKPKVPWHWKVVWSLFL